MILEEDMKIFIYNLCENKDIQYKAIDKIFKECYAIDEESIRNCFYNQNISNKIIGLLEKLDTSFLSVYSLLSIDINIFTIEKLRELFNSINDLSNNILKIDSNKIHPYVIKKIHQFVNKYEKIVYSKETIIERKIISIINKNTGPIPLKNLYLEINKIQSINDITIFYQIINKLSKEGKVKISSLGVEKNLKKIEEYLNENMIDKKYQIVMNFLRGEPIKEIAKQNGLSYQRLEQLIQNTINHFPMFDNEVIYYKIASEYSIDNNTLSTLGYNNIILVNYINIKYKINPQKNAIDYVLDNGMLKTEIGKQILKNNKLIEIDNVIYKIEFKGLFQRFIEINCFLRFNISDIHIKFLDFLKQYDIDIYQLGVEDINTFKRKIDRLDDCLPYGNGNYYIFKIESFDDNFIMSCTQYLENFYGYGSVKKFYKEYYDECVENNIENEYELFVILKKLYNYINQNNIDFINPMYIATNDLNKKLFFKELISTLQPIKLNKFYKYLESEYGLSEEHIEQNKSNWFGKYIGQNEVLSTESNRIDFENENVKKVLSIINNSILLSYSFFEKNVNESDIRDKEYFLNKFFLIKIDYKFTNEIIFKKEFSSMYDAAVCLSNNLPITMNQNSIQKYFPLQCIDTRYGYLKQQCVFLRFSDDSFLNIEKRIGKQKVIDFRNELIEELTLNEIYTIDILKNLNIYKKLKNNHIDVYCMVEAMGYNLLRSILESSLDITSINDNNVFVFGKGDRVTIRRLVVSIVKKRGSIERTELLEKLSKEFGINNEYTNSYFLEIGLYYNSISDKVYINQELCNEELINYLNKEN